MPERRREMRVATLIDMLRLKPVRVKDTIIEVVLKKEKVTPVKA